MSARFAARTSAAALELALALGLGACSFYSNVGESAIDYNKSYEISSNGITLLNILRAKDGLPMYFSTLSKVSGKLNYTVQSQLQLPFGQNLSSNSGWFNQFQSFFNLQGGPNYDISTENTKEFMQGILSPMDMEKLAYYWQQEWPRSMLLHMFLQSIEEKCPGDKVTHFNNGSFGAKRDDRDKRSFRSYAEFRDLIHDWLFKKNMSIASHSRFVEVGPPLSAAAVQSLLARPEALAAAKKEKLVLACRTSIKGKDDDCTESTPAGARVYRLGTYKSEFVLRLSSQSYRMKEKAPGRFSQELEGLPAGSQQCSFELAFRSVQGMIYYLGEIARYQDGDSRREPRVLTKGYSGEQPLMEILKGGAAQGRSVAAVTYGGAYYTVPLDSKTRSAQVFALVDQLFGLSRKADTLQQTPTVRVQN